ncbi:Derlin 1 [Podila clonocystis]|nr:Derlin 1 [Podila clonocystis]
MSENELLAKYKSVPLLTRSLMTATVVLSLAVSTNMLNSSVLVLHWPSIMYRFHVHRLLTPYFVTGVGFNFLFDMLFLHSYGSQLESSTFAGRPADFAWFLLFTCLTTSVVGYFMHFVFMFQALLASVIYLWSQANADRTVSFMFGLTFKAVYFPWVLFAYNYILMGATVPWTMLAGIASAHLFYFLDSLYPDMGGPKLIPTPALLYRFLPSEEVAGAEFTAGGGTATNFRPAGEAGTGGVGGGPGVMHRWGPGCRLG